MTNLSSGSGRRSTSPAVSIMTDTTQADREAQAREAAKAIMSKSTYRIWPADAERNIAEGLLAFATPPAGIDDAPKPAVLVGWKLVPADDSTRDFSDSTLPDTMIDAGIEAKQRAERDMREYEAGETIDWDDGMIVVAIYRAMLAAAPTPIDCAGAAGIDDDPPGDMTAVSKDGGEDGRHTDCGCMLCAADARVAALSAPPPVQAGEVEKAVMVCPQCEGEGGYPDGIDEDACHTDCTRCGGNGWVVDLSRLSTPVSQPIEDRIRAEDLLAWLADCDNLVLFNNPAGDWEVRRGRVDGQLRGSGSTPSDALTAALRQSGAERGETA